MADTLELNSQNQDMDIELDDKSPEFTPDNQKTPLRQEFPESNSKLNY